MMTEQTLGTTTITQVGIIVQDIEAKARAWAEVLGLPVPEIMITEPTIARKLNITASRRMRVPSWRFSTSDRGPQLIEPVGEPSTWQDQLDEHGDSLHHIAFEIKGMSEKVAYLDSKGLKLVQRGEYTGGRYAYINGNAQLGAILELLEND